MNKIIKKIIERKDDNCTYLDVIAEVCEEEGISIEDMASIIKDDETLLKIIESECVDRNLLKLSKSVQPIDQNIFE